MKKEVDTILSHSPPRPGLSHGLVLKWIIHCTVSFSTECDCDPFGTLENYECDRYTGDCICKRFVTGQRCDACMVSDTAYNNLYEELR